MEPSTKLEVFFTPAEFSALAQQDLSQTTCIVFDVLRATSTILTALANGATAVYPVQEITDALALRRQQPDALLAGERNGLRIRAEQTGGVDFDLGNSPREFTAERMRGKTVIMTTTNGTRALRACAAARQILIAAFLNLEAVARWVDEHQPSHLLLICSGTLAQASLEDVLAAGCLAERIWPHYGRGQVADSAEMARQLYGLWKGDLRGALGHSRNGRRLLGQPELAGDVEFCLQISRFEFIAGLCPGGAVQPLAPL